MLSFLFQFFEELLQLLIFFLHSLDNSSIFIVDIHQIRYLSFIFGHKKLLRFNLLSELFFHWFRRIFVEYQASQYFFILEIFLFVILQQIFFSVQIIFNCLNFLLIFFSDAFVGMRLICRDLLVDEKLTVQNVFVFFKLSDPVARYDEQTLLILKQFINFCFQIWFIFTNFLFEVFNIFLHFVEFDIPFVFVKIYLLSQTAIFSFKVLDFEQKWFRILGSWSLFSQSIRYYICQIFITI